MSIHNQANPTAKTHVSELMRVGYTVAEIARASNLSYSCIKDIHSGKTAIGSPRARQAIAGVYSKERDSGMGLLNPNRGRA